MTRPLLRHSMDQLEAMAPCPELVAELGHRSTQRAVRLLARLKSGTVSVMPIAAKPERKERPRAVPAVLPCQKKPVAAPRGSKPPCVKARKKPRYKNASPEPLHRGPIRRSDNEVRRMDGDYRTWYRDKFGVEYEPKQVVDFEGYVEMVDGKIRTVKGAWGMHKADQIEFNAMAPDEQLPMAA